MAEGVRTSVWRREGVGWVRGEGWERKTCEREISFRDDEEGSSGEKEKGEKKEEDTHDTIGESVPVRAV